MAFGISGAISAGAALAAVAWRRSVRSSPDAAGRRKTKSRLPSRIAKAISSCTAGEVSAPTSRMTSSEFSTAVR